MKETVLRYGIDIRKDLQILSVEISTYERVDNCRRVVRVERKSASMGRLARGILVIADNGRRVSVKYFARNSHG